MRFAVVYTERREEARRAAQRAKTFLEERGASVEVHSVNEIVGKKLSDRVDLAIALGGDGTILKTVRSLPRVDTPVLGVNFGRGGFLMEAEANMLEESLDRILRGDYRAEKAEMMAVNVNGKELGAILNEVYISSRKIGKLLEAEIIKTGSSLIEVEADGLIISTPIGSTAYSYSAGGPIVDDKLEAAVITAVCPVSNFRPMVLDLSRGFEVNTRSEFGFSILLDGFIEEKLENHVLRMSFKKSDRTVAFIRLGLGESFARRVRKKLR